MFVTITAYSGHRFHGTWGYHTDNITLNIPYTHYETGTADWNVIHALRKFQSLFDRKRRTV